MKYLRWIPLLFLFSCTHKAPVAKEVPPPKPVYAAAADMNRKDFHAEGPRFAIATQGIYASRAAQSMLEHGGNIIDATIAASFVISVERPQSTGIGGGGFLLFHDARSGQSFAVDFRERAPLLATETMFLDKKGEPIPTLSQNGAKAVAVPGLVAGLVTIHNKFGLKPLKDVMAPAIELAEKGFPVYPHLARALKNRRDVLAQDPGARKIFLNKKAEPWPEGHVLVQKDLGRTLRGIAARGRAGFYEGDVADRIVKFMKKRHGLVSAKDFAAYNVKWREPVKGQFRGYEVESMPPPSSGGVHVIQFLNMWNYEDFNQRKPLTADSIHLAAASLQMAFADRAKYLGDPDFVKVPVKGLTSPAYALQRRGEINMNKARHKDEVSAGEPAPYESTDTTHFSIIDSDGNAVASTQTINDYFGAAVVAPGTGVVLNDEMDDFSAKPGASNIFGAVGGLPNKIEPRKTPLSSMSPTFLLEKGQVKLAVGAPGGTRIISCVAQTVLNWAGFGLPLEDAVSLIRYHHQWSPDKLTIDPPGPAPEVLARLKAMGYDVELEAVPCHVMAVAKEGDKLKAAADPRDIGTGVAE